MTAVEKLVENATMDWDVDDIYTRRRLVNDEGILSLSDYRDIFGSTDMDNVAYAIRKVNVNGTDVFLTFRYDPAEYKVECGYFQDEDGNPEDDANTEESTYNDLEDFSDSGNFYSPWSLTEDEEVTVDGIRMNFDKYIENRKKDFLENILQMEIVEY